MDLRVTKMHFLDSGAISIEVFANVGDNAPPSTSIDNLSVRVYVPKSEIPTDLAALKEKAVAMARSGLR